MQTTTYNEAQQENQGIISQGDYAVNTVHNTTIHTTYQPVEQHNAYQVVNIHPGVSAEPYSKKLLRVILEAVVKAAVSLLLTLPGKEDIPQYLPVLANMAPVWQAVILGAGIYGVLSVFTLLYQYRNRRVVSALFLFALLVWGLVYLQKVLDEYAVVLDTILTVVVFSLVVGDVIRLVLLGISAFRERRDKGLWRDTKSSRM